MHLLIVEDERAVLEQICAWYRNGISLGSIAEKLNAAGVPYQPGETGWNKARLMRMLEDERYKSLIVYYDVDPM